MSRARIEKRECPTTVEVVASPDPEVRPPRQVYSAALKLRVLAGLAAADSKAERGEILRREGLYSSLVSEWRNQRERGALEAISGRRPGRLRQAQAHRGAGVRPAQGEPRLHRFCRRGNAAADSEWKLINATHNLLKIYRRNRRQFLGSRPGDPVSQPVLA